MLLPLCVSFRRVVADSPIPICCPKVRKGAENGHFGAVLGEQSEKEGAEEKHDGEQYSEIGFGEGNDAAWGGRGGGSALV